jgi:hypothetical protein
MFQEANNYIVGFYVFFNLKFRYKKINFREIFMENYRVMTESLKDAALMGDVIAQRLWMEEEINEFYEALELFIAGEATIFDVSEEVLGCFRTAQVFPYTRDLLVPHKNKLFNVLNALIWEPHYTYYKAKKVRKGQAADMTSENLLSFIQGFREDFLV